MKKLLVIILILFIAIPVCAESDTTTSTATSTATAGDTTNTITTTIEGGSGGSEGSGGVNITHPKQYRIAPAISNGAAAGVDGVGLTTPFGGAMYNKGNRFLNALALYNLKAANGMDCAREVAIMERETEETRFLWLIPMDSPFGIGQTKPLFTEQAKSNDKAESKPTEGKARDAKTGQYVTANFAKKNPNTTVIEKK